MSGARRRAVAVAAFVAISYGLAWLVALPLWLGDGLADPWFPAYALAIMATPAVAALAVTRWVERPARGAGNDGGAGEPDGGAREPDGGARAPQGGRHRGGETARGLGLVPLRPVGPLAAFLGAALLLPVLLVVGGLLIGALAGVYPADFAGLSAYRALLERQTAELGVELPAIPTAGLLAAQALNIVLGALVNTVPALGEELGWRGWLVPRLRPLGTLPMVLVSGVVWGLWHAPLVLLGYNYGGLPGWLALAAMCATTTAFGAVFAWLREASASVWPAALAHGTLNACAGLALFFAAPGPLHPLHVAPLGWTGWILPALLAAALYAAGRGLRRRPAPPRAAGGPSVTDGGHGRLH